MHEAEPDAARQVRLAGAMPRALFLDAGGVLLYPRPEIVARALGVPGGQLDAARVETAHYAGIAGIDHAPPDADLSRTYRAAFLAVLGIDVDDGLDARLQAGFRDPGMWERAADGAAALVRRCAEVGLPVVIVSNWDGSIARRLEAAGVCQEGPGPLGPVARIIDSGAVGVEKPDPGIFLLALDSVGVTHAEALHVGDTISADIVGAEAVGIPALHLEPSGSCDIPGHDHVRSLHEVADLIGIGPLAA